VAEFAALNPKNNQSGQRSRTASLQVALVANAPYVHSTAPKMGAAKKQRRLLTRSTPNPNPKWSLNGLLFDHLNTIDALAEIFHLGLRLIGYLA
jgi:hypothetical protein